MNTTTRLFQALLVPAFLTAFLGACSTTKPAASQLERIAKDWALGIRASQVIPVYPLTEDLQPGDVFLVQTPVEEQTRLYLEKGFLPLENLVTRLRVSGYQDFYAGWPEVEDGSNAPPRRWQFPEAGTPDFSRAPLAAFPTYSFSVSRSGGLSLAIPVQAVPLGLNLLDSASADGTITLKDAHTYALPTRLLWDSIHSWAQSNQAFLAQYQPTEGSKEKAGSEFFLRVVHRVYLVKTVNVTLFANRASAGEASAGVPGEVKLLNIADTTEASKRFEEVNKVLANAADPSPAEAAAGAIAPIKAGGTVRVAMATARDVSLVETFQRPLVIGYLATDYRILKDGRLDSPVPTMARLENRPVSQGKPIAYTGCDDNCGKLRVWLRAPGSRDALTEWLEGQPDPVPIADLLTGNHADLRARAVKALIQP